MAHRRGKAFPSTECRQTIECVQKRENGEIFFVKFTTYEEQCKELVLRSLRVKEDSDHKNCFYLSKVCYGQEGPKGER